MRKVLLFCFYVIFVLNAFAQKPRVFSYSAVLHAGNTVTSNIPVQLKLSISTDAHISSIVYAETHRVMTDSNGVYSLEIGNGVPVFGVFDSILWSYGNYYLHTEAGIADQTLKHTTLMRMATDLANDNKEETVVGDSLSGWGNFDIPNSRHKRPKKVTVDLSTAYTNINYPGDTYPIYRHYEWADEDRDGLGNAFCISYSDHTTHAFAENTNVLGDVRLYPKAFQQLKIRSDNSVIAISITKPVPVQNLSETYAIKGPWKIIYFIEW